MNDNTRDRIYRLLEDFTKTSLKKFDIEQLKLAYPFHRLFFDDVSLEAFKQERSIVTRMGMNLYPELARLIALENNLNVEREKEIRGDLDEAIVIKIDRIVRDLRANKRQPDRDRELQEIFDVEQTQTISKTVPVRVIADLYVENLNNVPCFFEIKTPMPNLDIAAESKAKILTFIALLKSRTPQGYLAFAYNPFVTRAAYKHNPTKRIMDVDREVLMGSEFWDLIGGSGTFSELLEIIEDVGNKMRNG